MLQTMQRLSAISDQAAGCPRLKHRRRQRVRDCERCTGSRADLTLGRARRLDHVVV